MMYELSFPGGSTGSNGPPVVDAGVDQSITLGDGAVLDGSVSDDGLPDPPGVVTTVWSQVSGPGAATFGDAKAVDTSVSFSAAGSYVLRLTADDSVLSTSDEVTVTVSGPGGVTAFEVRVAGSSDDGEERAGGVVALTSSDLELVFDGGGNRTGWSSFQQCGGAERGFDR